MFIDRDDYCFRYSDFYESPQHISGAALANGSHAFRLRTLPAGWSVRGDPDWTRVGMDSRTLPDQGWKIHVSSTLDQAQGILDEVANICFELEADFKFAPGIDELYRRNAKYANRATSGKFIAIYPADDECLEHLVLTLDEALGGRPGPYILTDLRWREGPVYVRYGAFVFRECLNAEGQTVPALMSPDGRLVPDERRPVFFVPEFAPRPGFLEHEIHNRLAPPAEEDADEFPYDVSEALHYSNGGGVYLAAHRDGSPSRIVLKEGRPFAGLDPSGVAADERLKQEAWALRKLADVPEVPDCYDLFTSWEHTFLAQTHVPGITLYQWTAQNYPFSPRASTAEYDGRAQAIIRRLQDVLGRVHQAGVAVGDVQPRNVIIGEDDSVHLIDFETASEVSTEARAPFGTPGFVPPVESDAVTADLFGLSRVAMHLFSPVSPLSQISPLIWDHQRDYVADEFSIASAALLDELDDAFHLEKMHGRHEPCGESWSLADIAEGQPLQRLCDGIVSARRADDPDNRLFPGDPQQFVGLGTLNIENGAAGVLLMLSRAGTRNPTDVAWLRDRALAVRANHANGLFDGTLGIAGALAELGEQDAAQTLISSLRSGWEAESQDVSLYSGLSGHALGLMSLGSLLQSVRDKQPWMPAIERLEGLLDEPPKRLASSRSTNHKPIGLLDAWSGVALTFIAMANATGDVHWFDKALRAIDIDLANCVTANDGSLQVDDIVRMMPYLDEGSAGIAFALANVPTRFRSAAHDRALQQIRLACQARSYANSGLFSGRAGMLAVLAGLPESAFDDISRQEAIDSQLRRLSLHGFASTAGDRGINFAGLHCLKLSSDFATGTAGVLGAVIALRDGPNRWLPVPLPEQIFPALRDHSEDTNDSVEGGGKK